MMTLLVKVMAKSTISDDPVSEQDKFMLRLPKGMRERIKAAADRNGRSMNAELVAVLEQYYPPEPTLDEIVDRVHSAIDLANQPWAFPYRKVLVDALDQLSERLTKGIEFEQAPARVAPPADPLPGYGERIRRWRRAQKYGVEQADLEDEIRKGLLRRYQADTVQIALNHFSERHPDRALRMLKLDNIKFENPEAAHAAIEKDLRAYFEENWGDPETWEPDERG